MTNDAQNSGTAFIQPLSITVPIDGVEVLVTPIELRELPNAIALAMPLFASLRISAPDYLTRLRDGSLTTDEMSALLMSVVVSGEEYIGLLALFSRQPADWIGRLLLDRAAELALTCVHVNADFFGRAMSVFSALASQAGKLAHELETSATQKPSSSS